MDSRKKLLVVLGAGSSVGVGMPSVGGVNTLMREWANGEGLYDNTRLQPDFFNLAWKALQRHTPSSSPDFERALGLLVGLANWVRPRPHGQVLRDLVEAETQLPSFFADCQLSDNSLQGFGPSCVVTSSYVKLLIKLAEEFRRRCRALCEQTSDEFERYQKIIRTLVDHFDVGIVSLNYDNAALRAWPEAFCGFSERPGSDGLRAFEPASVHSRSTFGFIYHLHGSVHHTLPTIEKGLSVFHSHIKWQDDLGGIFVDGEPSGSNILDRRSDGNEIPTTTLIAGGLKLDQMLSEPFQSLYAAVQRHTHEADAVLVAGYGFGDMHVNRMLLSRVTRGGDVPPIIILDRTHDDTPTMFSRRDGWPSRMRFALSVGAQNFDLIRSATVAPIKQKLWFETAGDKVAVWHNGFLEAEDQIARIVGFLDGDPGALDGYRTKRRGTLP